MAIRRPLMAENRRLRLPVTRIATLEDCLAISAWAAVAVLRGQIDRGTCDAAVRAAREWRQANQATTEVARRKALERRIAELEERKRP
jgi:hypothetical protein